MDLITIIRPLIKFRKVGVLVCCANSQGFISSYYQIAQSQGVASVKEILANLLFDDMAKVAKLHSTQMPMLLSYHGEGLMQKISDTSSVDFLVNKPNLQQNEFVTESQEIESPWTYHLLARKEKMLSLVKDLQVTGIEVNQIFLGFSPIFKASELFLKKETELVMASLRLGFTNQQRLFISKHGVGEASSENNTIDPGSAEIVALACAISFFTNSKNPDAGDFQELLENNKELIASRLTRNILSGIFPVLLVMLFVNLLLFDHYEQRLKTTELARSNEHNLQNRIEQVRKEVNDEKEFQLKAGLNHGSAFAYYVDRLAAINVIGVQFEEMEIDPVVGKIRQDEQISIKHGVIVLRGSVEEAEQFSTLLYKLKEAPWVKAIEKQTYLYNEDKGRADFELMLSYQEPI